MRLVRQPHDPYARDEIGLTGTRRDRSGAAGGGHGEPTFRLMRFSSSLRISMTIGRSFSRNSERPRTVPSVSDPLPSPMPPAPDEEPAEDAVEDPAACWR